MRRSILWAACWTLVVTVIVLVIGTGAWAAEREVEGAGRIRAVGTGVIHVRGQGHVSFTLHGAGELVVAHPNANKIEAHGHGERIVENGRVIFRGWRGRVEVRGRRIDCRFHGGRVNFRGTGRGTVYLKGKGKVWVNGGRPRNWPQNGKTIEYGKDPSANTGDDA